MTYKWTERAVCSYYYDQDTGKVVGDIFRQNFSDDIWTAKVNGDYLGDYISSDKAKKAIEKKIEEVDQGYAQLNPISVCGGPI